MAPDQPHAMKTADESSTNLRKLLTAVERENFMPSSRLCHWAQTSTRLMSSVSVSRECARSYKIDLVEFLIQHGAVTGQQRDLEGPPLKLLERITQPSRASR